MKIFKTKNLIILLLLVCLATAVFSVPKINSARAEEPTEITEQTEEPTTPEIEIPDPQESPTPRTVNPIWEFVLLFGGLTVVFVVGIFVLYRLLTKKDYY